MVRNKSYRSLLLNIWEVFLELKKINPGIQIGFQIFSKLGPEYIEIVNLGGTHRVYKYVSIINMLNYCYSLYQLKEITVIFFAGCYIVDVCEICPGTKIFNRFWQIAF